ncbi:pca operon transcription factor PcaQ [Verticiella sediminum]|uniref:Pca operon transcription factor PcaQ n=1 Tax=Verticiella sediminum TaxID=1247510 RepID=A0A556A7Y8_9BURK|nr:pca operon transcription factor PcaQ [Verticiella sediminum]TSH88997.1 pca operon transcription factor PcaQ [Verticiella sediminum]
MENPPAGGLGSRQGAAHRLRLRHLHCFLAVARLGRLSSAAETLAISQPAVTKTLNELEDILGARLFVRGRRGVALTAQAQAFLPHVGLCLEALERAIASVAPALASPPLRVGCLPTVASAVLAPALRRLRSSHPETAMHVVTGSNLELLRALRRRDLDLVVGRLSDPDELGGLRFEFLYAEPLAAVVRPGHPLARRSQPRMADLADYGLVLPPAGTMLRHAADALLLAAGISRPRVAVQTLSDSLARSLIDSGDEVWLTAPSAVEAFVDSGVLVRLPIPTGGSEEPVGVLTQTDAVPSGISQALQSALREQAAARAAVPA